MSKKYLKVTQIGSTIGRKVDQTRTLVGLKLKKMHASSVLEDTDCIRGMIKKVRHLIKVEEVI